jgi:hypothetical protein
MSYSAHSRGRRIRSSSKRAPTQVPAVQSLLALTANPKAPYEVNVSQPSDVLVARAAAAGAFDSLFLGLGVVALIASSACWPGRRGNGRVRQLEELGRRDPRRGVVGRHRLGHPDRRVRWPDARQIGQQTARPDQLGAFTASALDQLLGEPLLRRRLRDRRHLPKHYELRSASHTAGKSGPRSYTVNRTVPPPSTDGKSRGT